MADYKEWIKYKNSKRHEKKKNRLFVILKIIFVGISLFAIKDIISVIKNEIINLLIARFPTTFGINQKLMDYGVWLDFLLATTIILFIFKISVNVKPKINQATNYRREFKGLLEPALAETINDGSLNMKEMIMSIIVQLKLKGNLEIIDNENIVLIHEYNLEKYEEQLIKLIFKDKQIMSFKDINNLFDSKNIGESVKSIYDIKVNILKELKLRELFNNEYMQQNANINGVAYLIIANLPCIYLIGLMIMLMAFKGFGFVLLLIYILYNIILFGFLTDSILTESRMIELYAARGNFLKGIRGRIFLENIPIIINIIGIIVYYNMNKLLVIEYILILLLNILMIKKKNIAILSKKGQQEKIKLLELKKYIEDYSLLDDKDLTAVNIWDEYLAYAVAFGIPNKITDKIYENWYNFNIVKQYLKN